MRIIKIAAKVKIKITIDKDGNIVAKGLENPNEEHIWIQKFVGSHAASVKLNEPDEFANEPAANLSEEPLIDTDNFINI